MATRKESRAAERSAHGHWYYHAAPRHSHGEAERDEIVVCIHGACTGGWYWKQALVALSTFGFHAYAPDIMGHGRAPEIHSIGSASILDYVADIRDFIERVVAAAHPESPIILVGHSMGGLIAIKLAETLRVHRLILLSPAPPGGIEYKEGDGLRVSFLEKAQAALAMSLELPFKPSKEVVASSLVHLLGKPEELDRVYARFVAESSRVGKEIYFGWITIDPKKIRAQRLVVVGEFDRVIHPAVAHNVARFLGTKALVKPGRGHMLVLEPGWREVVADIVGWIKQTAKKT